MAIRVTALDRELGRVSKRLVAAADRAAVQGLNRAAAGARTEWSKAIRRTYGMKARVVRRRLTVVKARRGRVRAEVVAGRYLLRPAEFGPVQARTGVRFKFKKKGPKVIHGAFFATMRSGHHSVFYRKGRKRLPIAEQTFGRFSVVAEEAYTPDVNTRIERRLVRELRRTLDVQLRRIA